MRVLCSTYPWAFETPGGGEIQIEKYLHHAPQDGLELVRHDMWSASMQQADLVHFFSVVGGSSAFCGYVRQRGLPLVISASLWITPQTRDHYPADEIRHQLLMADAIITNGVSEADGLATVLDLPRERFRTVFNAADPVFAEPVDPEMFRDRFEIRGPFLLHVGNIEPRKNQKRLMAAARQLGLPLILIGHVRDPAYWAECLREPHGHVRHVGALAHDDPLLRSAYAGCAVFCLPSMLETPGLAALEAAAAGARLVVTSEGSTREYFADHATYVAPGEERALVEALTTALDTPPNDALARHVRRHFLWPEVIGQLRAVYREVGGQT